MIPTKFVTLTFKGGYWDGQVFRFDPTNPDSQDSLAARNYWFLLKGGGVGNAFSGINPDALLSGEISNDKKPHWNNVYKVVSREENDTEINIVIEHSFMND